MHLQKFLEINKIRKLNISSEIKDIYITSGKIQENSWNTITAF